MQKRFIAVSLTVVALVLVFSCSARSARADSIHSHDFKFDSFGSSASACNLACVLDSVLKADRQEISGFFAEETSEFGWNGRFNPEYGFASGRDGRFEFPIASHFTHRQGDGDRRSSTVPEPSSLLLAAVGLAGILLPWRSRRRNPPFPPAAV
jgi:hypothetical protein